MKKAKGQVQALTGLLVRGGGLTADRAQANCKGQRHGGRWRSSRRRALRRQPTECTGRGGSPRRPPAQRAPNLGVSPGSPQVTSKPGLVSESTQRQLNLGLTLRPCGSDLGQGVRACGGDQKYLRTLAEVLSDDGGRGGRPGRFGLVGHDAPPAHAKAALSS